MQGRPRRHCRNVAKWSRLAARSCCKSDPRTARLGGNAGSEICKSDARQLGKELHSEGRIVVVEDVRHPCAELLTLFHRIRIPKGVT